MSDFDEEKFKKIIKNYIRELKEITFAFFKLNDHLEGNEEFIIIFNGIIGFLAYAIYKATKENNLPREKQKEIFELIYSSIKKFEKDLNKGEYD